MSVTPFDILISVIKISQKWTNFMFSFSFQQYETKHLPLKTQINHETKRNVHFVTYSSKKNSLLRL